MSRTKKVLIGVGAFFLLSCLVLTIWLGPIVADAYRNGFLDSALQGEKQREYAATNEENLKALHLALQMYHDSEGHYPEAAGWMDAIENRIQAGDMSPEEAEKKFHRPDMPGGFPFGYAINKDAAGKYVQDIQGSDDPILVFETDKSEENAAGDPVTDIATSKRAITVKGNIVGQKPAQ